MTNNVADHTHPSRNHTRRTVMRTVSVRQCLKGIAHISDSHFELSSGSTNVDGVVSLRLALQWEGTTHKTNRFKARSFGDSLGHPGPICKRSLWAKFIFWTKLYNTSGVQTSYFATCHLQSATGTVFVADETQESCIQDCRLLVPRPFNSAAAIFGGSCRCDPVRRSGGNPERSCQHGVWQRAKPWHKKLAKRDSRAKAGTQNALGWPCSHL